MVGEDTLYLAVRVMTCGIWAGAGLFKLTHFKGFTEKMAHLRQPVPPVSAVVVVAIELIGSLLLIANLYVSEVCLVWIAFIIYATPFEHRPLFDEKGAIVFPQYVHWWKNLSLIGGLCALILLDPGKPAWLHGLIGG